MYGYKTKVMEGGYDKYNLDVSSCALTATYNATKPTDKPSTGASLETPEDRQHVGQNKPSPGTPVPGDRLHRGRTSLPLGPFSGCTKGQATRRTDKSSPGTLFRVHQGTDYTEDGQVFLWVPFQ